MPSVHNFLCYRRHFVIYSFNSPDLQNFLKEWANKQNTIHNKIEMKRTVKYKLGKGFALNIRVKPFYIVKVSSSVSRSLIRFNR